MTLKNQIIEMAPYLHPYISELPSNKGTVCPGSSDPFHIVSYYIKWVTTSWTYSTMETTLKENPDLMIFQDG